MKSGLYKKNGKVYILSEEGIIWNELGTRLRPQKNKSGEIFYNLPISWNKRKRFYLEKDILPYVV